MAQEQPGGKDVSLEEKSSETPVEKRIPKKGARTP